MKTALTGSKASLAMQSEQHVGKLITTESKEVLDRWPEYYRDLCNYELASRQRGAQEENEEQGASLLRQEVDVTVCDL